MNWLIIIVVVIVALIILPRVFASEETKLFRRVWAAEKLNGPHSSDARLDAVRALAERYDVDFTKRTDELRPLIGKLLADATEFDLRNPNNLGVQVMPAIATTLLALKSNLHPELTDDLLQMSRVDGRLFMQTLGR